MLRKNLSQENQGNDSSLEDDSASLGRAGL